MAPKGTHGQAIEWAYPQPHAPQALTNQGIKTSPFQVATKRFEIDENVTQSQRGRDGP